MAILPNCVGTTSLPAQGPSGTLPLPETAQDTKPSPYIAFEAFHDLATAIRVPT